ncbi:hypothetical protein C8R44DRAFT_747111 [Mycena epipterygia]|nr:hypothetical protein C8R44DRAFT_747111 [Mycena epipterygia]
MQFNILTLFAVVYAATQINAQTTFLCKCITNGVEDLEATTACCNNLGTLAISVWFSTLEHAIHCLRYSQAERGFMVRVLRVREPGLPVYRQLNHLRPMVLVQPE